MALKLIANYAKRLGLPGYSSHQFSISLEIELTNVEDVPGESARLYTTLQQAVDEQMQNTGFVPPDGYGMSPGTPLNGSSNGNGTSSSRLNGGNGNGRLDGSQEAGNGNGRSFERWSCTDGQKGFLLRLVSENNLKKEEVEALAQQLFGAGVRHCDKLQMSQLLEDLLEKTGKQKGRRPSFRREEVRR